MAEVTEKLAAAALDVDVFAVAQRIMADPGREAVGITAAEALALAWATHRFGAIAKETVLLVAACKLRRSGDEAKNARRLGLFEEQLGIVDDMLRGLSPASAKPQPEGETT